LLLSLAAVLGAKKTWRTAGRVQGSWCGSRRLAAVITFHVGLEDGMTAFPLRHAGSRRQ